MHSSTFLKLMAVPWRRVSRLPCFWLLLAKKNSYFWLVGNKNGQWFQRISSHFRRLDFLPFNCSLGTKLLRISPAALGYSYMLWYVLFHIHFPPPTFRISPHWIGCFLGESLVSMLKTKKPATFQVVVEFLRESHPSSGAPKGAVEVTIGLDVRSRQPRVVSWSWERVEFGDGVVEHVVLGYYFYLFLVERFEKTGVLVWIEWTHHHKNT